ncbi:MAG: hypothetical protein ABS98_03750 [Lysobacteraceae bacterium SCN 69-48]|nr:MAG: hypothetical protein ABS98_03750 [Xanthomonadaceae bacterium SCN 69-48]
MPHQIASTGRILVITAATDAETPLVTLLRRHGHTLLVVDDGARALALAAGNAPDLVLLDLPIPGVVAPELLAALHAQPQPIPAIVVTTAPDQQRLLGAFAAGAMDYIDGSCPPEELLARVQVHLRLKLTRDRLAQVARERQQLVNLVAHDLKNPLASVLFACEMLALADGRPERVPRYLRIIEDSAREALGHIRSYLEGQSQPADPGLPPTDACARLDDTLHWLAARYEAQLEASGMRLDVDAPDGACVAIDAQVLRQVCENLLSNALKYAREGGELRLSARPGTGGGWRLAVEDRGPGIPGDFQPRLFEPFQRVHGNDRAAAASSGLGLALARQIIADAGGRLWYEDRRGGGACFLLELPRADCSGPCAGAQTP